MSPAGRTLLRALKSHGLLLTTDAKLPSAVALLAGGPVRGTWWSHPEGNKIYNAINELADDPDVLTARLVSKKVTYVHRPLWAALAAVGREDAPWQRAGLPAEARSLLQRLRKSGSLRTDEIPGKGAGDAAKALELRLLLVSSQIHTDSGAHAKCLWTWDAWASEHALSGPYPTAAAGRAALEAAAEAYAAGTGAKAKLPWL